MIEKLLVSITIVETMKKIRGQISFGMPGIASSQFAKRMGFPQLTIAVTLCLLVTIE